MTPRIQTHSFRRKSRVRDLLSRALAACGVALYDMLLGETSLGSAPEPAAVDSPAVVRPAESGDLAALAQREGAGASERFAVNAGLGSRCLVAVCDATVVGYAWFNTAFIEFLGETLGRLPAGVLFIHNVFVFPEHRGHRTLQQLLAGIRDAGRAAGIGRAACVVDRANAPALAAFRRAGWCFRTAPIVKLPGMRPVLVVTRSLRAPAA